MLLKFERPSEFWSEIRMIILNDAEEFVRLDEIGLPT